MFLKNTTSGDLFEVSEIPSLTDPNERNVRGRYQAGEEIGDVVAVEKKLLQFPSGEPLPKCWLDPHYRISF